MSTLFFFWKTDITCIQYWFGTVISSHTLRDATAQHNMPGIVPSMYKSTILITIVFLFYGLIYLLSFVRNMKITHFNYYTIYDIVNWQSSQQQCLLIFWHWRNTILFWLHSVAHHVQFRKDSTSTQTEQHTDMENDIAPQQQAYRHYDLEWAENNYRLFNFALYNIETYLNKHTHEYEPRYMIYCIVQF